MTTTQPSEILQVQADKLRSLLTECHDYLKPVHEQFMRAEKHEEAIHRVGSDLFKRICCALDGQAEPSCSCPSGDGSLRYPCPAHEHPARTDLLPWTDSMVRELVSVALRHVDVKGTLHAQDIRDALKHMADRYPAPITRTTPQPEQSGLVGMIDAAMIEMRNIAPPLRRSDCERLIRAVLSAVTAERNVLRKQVKILQSAENSWQSGYDKGRHDGTRHRQSEVDQLRIGVDRLRAFANEIVSGAFVGGSFDGGEIQNMGVKHGLLRIEQRENECGEDCACREYGFPTECYRKTELLRAVMTAKETL